MEEPVVIVKIKYFGVNTSMIGEDERSVELPSNSTVVDLIVAIQKDVKDPIEKILESAVYFVNKNKVYKNEILKDGDSVIILFAIGGG